MLRQTPLVTGETYHIYNRGAHKGHIFNIEADYVRFLTLLYLSNNTEPVHISKLLLTKKYQGRSLKTAFDEESTDKSLVDILAYCLMPNHFHLVLRQKSEDGITVFMRRLLTGYSMYFNIKYEHSGVLFQGRFKSKVIGDESYFRYIFSYIHLNPIELIEPQWKERGIIDTQKVRNFLEQYDRSSFRDYAKIFRAERKLLAYDEAPDFLKNGNDLEDLLSWQQTSRTVLEVG